ncbi:MAG: hypothetical protein A3C35_01260 [Omnitrophica bacterium RIFCSPHIGHO2_02_FULL_46_11]|nr:MAG: hypothetical protein A3C35_01260 [Omnitrophica bacterium RIFCSPHIGHO2_02_FULL_46_11]OGW87081.1 MAG: hypothetical protein A3A81_00625 [Omnitrophica bacterium RIFCSPLOWO2_01_FULL_45_10b]
MHQNKRFIFVAGFIAQIFLTGVCFSSSTDELMGRAVNVATSLARRDVNGAAGQAIGGYNVPLTAQTNLSLGLGNIGLRQAIKPLSSSNPYLNVGSTYNAATAFGFNSYPNLSQNFQVNSNNRYFSNTTTIPTNFKRHGT